jgi:hypothetical protein
MALGLLSACGDDGGGSGETSETGAGTDESGTADDVGTEAGTESADTDVDTDADTTDAETDAETETEAEADAETDAETDATDETGNSACANIEDADECAGTDGCQAVNGSKLKENGPDSPCLEPSEFIGCIAEQGCDDALTWFCQGNGTYQVPNTCGPEGAESCEGPVDRPAACP